MRPIGNFRKYPSINEKYSLAFHIPAYLTQEFQFITNQESTKDLPVLKLAIQVSLI